MAFPRDRAMLGASPPGCRRVPRFNNGTWRGNLMSVLIRQISRVRAGPVLLCCALSWSCSKSTGDSVQLRGRTIAGSPTRSIVFSASQTTDALPILGRCTETLTTGVTDTFTPESAIVQAIDEQITGVVEHALVGLSANRHAAATPDNYYHQLFGLIKEGRRVVLVNGVHRMFLQMPDANASGGVVHGSLSEDAIQREPIVLCDAGWGRFFTLYDLQTRSFGAIYFSGSYGASVHQ